MRPGVVILVVTMMFPVTWANGGNPNNSIIRERTLPTPYGLRLVRASVATVGDLLPSGVVLDEVQEELPVAGLSLGRYLESIENAEISGGAYAADLVEPLASTGRVLQDADEHKQAMNFFRRALHLSRVNEGLYTARQLPVLDGMIESQLALGQVGKADENYHYRYRVQQQVYAADDPALINAALEYTDWQRQAYLSGHDNDTYLRLLKMHKVHTDNIERIAAQNENDPALIPHLYQRLMAEYLLSGYEGEKEEEVQVNISNGQEASFAVTGDLEQHEFEMLKNNNFRSGLNTMEKVVDLLEAQEQPDIDEIVRAKIALGDWYLWWDWRARALQAYEEAFALYADDSNPATDPQALFVEPVELPEEPVFRPGEFAAPPHNQARARVSLNVSRLGRARDIEILELQPAGSMGARVALFELLREIRFRPLVRDGAVVATESVVREYNFDY